MEEFNGKEMSKILVELSKKYPKEFKEEVWDKILGSGLSTKVGSEKILEWCLKKLKSESNNS
ncbi:hypothetical protein LCGC14_1535740 [marine sediment metagenome]|uniref:Uncharacterized protein n=1 Tax=marine sediment metagenome TaxID=412755 RepID=A0A0F9IUN2_9ZZZZ|nr:hypothetical protein [bacterium]